MYDILLQFHFLNKRYSTNVKAKAMNPSQKKDTRFWKKWLESGAIERPDEKIIEILAWGWSGPETKPHDGFRFIYSGETCGMCNRKANVLFPGAGWFCPCGHYNVQSFSHHQPAHVKPDIGPSRRKIELAIATIRA